MILVDVTHTSHTPARTGIQQLIRRMIASAGPGEVTPVTYDKYWGCWRSLDPHESGLARSGVAAARKRGARWSPWQRWRGRIGRLIHRKPEFPARADALLAPEFFPKESAAAYKELFRRINGPRVALFYDTIPLTHPEFTPAGTVARFPGYLEELRQFDGVAAISNHSRHSLAGYWRWAGGHAPPVVTIECGIEKPPAGSSAPARKGRPQVLALGTIEGRKNHAALFDAAEALWSEGLDFELHVVGMARRETAATAIDTLESLIARGRPIRFHGALPDDALEDRWLDCRFSVYPSVVEGFGLPIAESLARGRPCICSAKGATGEVASRGGCLPLESVDTRSLAAAIRRLIVDEPEYERLRREAVTRPLRTSADYWNDIVAWIEETRSRSA